MYKETDFLSSPVGWVGLVGWGWWSVGRGRGVSGKRVSNIWIVYLVRLLSALLNPEARSRGGRSSISSLLSRR